jgi:hypothetical protein
VLSCAFLCSFWGLLLGPRGILPGAAQYFVILCADLFLYVFGPSEKNDAER